VCACVCVCFLCVFCWCLWLWLLLFVCCLLLCLCRLLLCCSVCELLGCCWVDYFVLFCCFLFFFVFLESVCPWLFVCLFSCVCVCVWLCLGWGADGVCSTPLRRRWYDDVGRVQVPAPLQAHTRTHSRTHTILRTPITHDAYTTRDHTLTHIVPCLFGRERGRTKQKNKKLWRSRKITLKKYERPTHIQRTRNTLKHTYTCSRYTLTLCIRVLVDCVVTYAHTHSSHTRTQYKHTDTLVQVRTRANTKTDKRWKTERCSSGLFSEKSWTTWVYCLVSWYMCLWECLCVRVCVWRVRWCWWGTIVLVVCVSCCVFQVRACVSYARNDTRINSTHMRARAHTRTPHSRSCTCTRSNAHTSVAQFPRSLSLSSLPLPLQSLTHLGWDSQHSKFDRTSSLKNLHEILSQYSRYPPTHTQTQQRHKLEHTHVLTHIFINTHTRTRGHAHTITRTHHHTHTPSHAHTITRTHHLTRTPHSYTHTA